MSEKLYINHDENIEFGIVGNELGINVTDHCKDKSAWLCFNRDQFGYLLERLHVYKNAIDVYEETGNMPRIERGTRPRPEPDPRVALIATKRKALERAHKIVKKEDEESFLFPLRFNGSKFKHQKEARKDREPRFGLLPVKDFEKKVLACSDIVRKNDFTKLDEITDSKNFGVRIPFYVIESLQNPEVTIKQLWVWYAYLSRFFSQDLSKTSAEETQKIRDLAQKYFLVEEYSSEERLEALEGLLVKESGETSNLIMHAAKILEHMVPDDISFDFLQTRTFFLKEEEDQILSGREVGDCGPDFFIGDWKDILAFQGNDR